MGTRKKLKIPSSSTTLRKYERANSGKCVNFGGFWRWVFGGWDSESEIVKVTGLKKK
jgi:hypothetical protein